MPQLVLRLDKFINDTKPLGKWVPNLKGFMVGNGVTNWKYDCDPAYFHMAYYHGLISDELVNAVQANNCDFSYIDAPQPPPLSPICATLFDKFLNLTSLVNVYDVFGKCWKNPSAFKANKMARELSDSPQLENEGLTAAKYTSFLKSSKRTILKDTPPCVYSKSIIDYFTDPLVLAQLNIVKESPKWDLCADVSVFNYTSAQNASQWIYPIVKGRYKILKYSGDTDGAVPTYGTQQWINELNWPILEAWRPYYIQNMYGTQVAGYVEKRDGLLFVTVHGAGHMAPQWKKQETYHAVFNFINNKPL